MRRSRQKSSHYQRSIHPAESLHLRLCHCCLYLNESPTEIIQCHRCQNYLTIEPFMDQLPPDIRAQWEKPQDDVVSEESDSSGPESYAVRKRTPGLAGLAVLW